MKDETELKTEFKKLHMAIVCAGGVITITSLLIGDFRIATQVVAGGLFSLLNIYFYAAIAAAILIKKNIAWIGPVIVIKYLLLIIFLYLIWKYSDVLWVLAGLFSMLVLTGLGYATIKFVSLKGTK